MSDWIREKILLQKWSSKDISVFSR